MTGNDISDDLQPMREHNRARERTGGGVMCDPVADLPCSVHTKATPPSIKWIQC